MNRFHARACIYALFGHQLIDGLSVILEPLVCIHPSLRAEHAHVHQTRLARLRSRIFLIISSVNDVTLIALFSLQGHDDATAILLAIHAPAVRLLGISTVCPFRSLSYIQAN